MGFLVVILSCEKVKTFNHQLPSLSIEVKRVESSGEQVTTDEVLWVESASAECNPPSDWLSPISAVSDAVSDWPV